MDLPVFRRGLELVSSQLNKLSQGIRAAQITSVIGGSFTRTPGGTTLIIDQPATGGSAGTSAPCPFKVSDVSNPEETTLFIRIQQDKIEQRYPYQMTGTGNFDKQIPVPWVIAGITWVAVYIIIKVNELGQIHSENNAIRVVLSDKILESYGANQVFLLAEISLSYDKAGKLYISNISNACPLIQVQNNGFCPFEVSNIYNNLETFTDPIIQIQNGKIEARTPDGMTSGGYYTLEIPDDGEWHAVYCVLAVDVNGNIMPGDGSISFNLYNNWQENTGSVQFVLIGEVTTSYDGFGKRYISFIQNYCLIPSSFKSSSFVCWYKSSNASTLQTSRIEVSQFALPTNNPSAPYMWPVGMGIGYPPFYLEVNFSCYIYLGVFFDTITYLVSPFQGSVFIQTSSEILQNTAEIQYIILGTVFVNSDGIASINNICSQPEINPCLLQLETPPPPLSE